MSVEVKPLTTVQEFIEDVEGIGMSFSTGGLAKQANGSVTVQIGETIVFVAVTAADDVSPEQDYFPLSVEYREKFCAAGRFPGGYVKREGRPSEREILTARLCDRPLRPLFPDGFRNDVQVVGMLLSADLKHEPDVLMVNGASAALLCSDIPWAGPIGCVRVGEIDGQFVLLPTNEQIYGSSLDLLYVGNEQDMLMIEGSADQISEERFLEALAFAQEKIQPIIQAQKRLAERVKRERRQMPTFNVDEKVIDFCRENFATKLEAALFQQDKLRAEQDLKRVREDAHGEMATHFGDQLTNQMRNMALEAVLKEVVCSNAFDNQRRMDGRGFDEIRSIFCETGFLPRVHGVSLFQRGETQAMVSATLGTSRDVQSLDGITGGVNEKSFILHYNFPPFSVGETGRFGSPGRREIGHGALAERSLLPVIPPDTVFPYSIRLVSEVLESNGSSSMASVCGGTLALMDAGVPILAPVTGISIGLVTRHDDQGKICDYRLLTDIVGLEDHYGEMDFKIAGTSRGITGFQLDLKLPGLPFDIAAEAVRRNGEARKKIEAIMLAACPEPRSELRDCAPRMKEIQIPADKIGALIGPGGKTVKRIVEATGAQVDINDDNSGRVMIFAPSEESLQNAIREVKMIISDIEVGETYRGVVRGIKEFGAFVECLPGKEGLVHISELDDERVENTEDICKLGDEIVVRCIGVDEQGRVKLSRKAIICERKGIRYEPPQPQARMEVGRSSSPFRRSGGDDSRGGNNRPGRGRSSHGPSRGRSNFAGGNRGGGGSRGGSRGGYGASRGPGRGQQDWD